MIVSESETWMSSILKMAYVLQTVSPSIGYSRRAKRPLWASWLWSISAKSHRRSVKWLHMISLGEQSWQDELPCMGKREWSWSKRVRAEEDWWKPERKEPKGVLRQNDEESETEHLGQGSPTCGSGAACSSFKTLVGLQMLKKIPLYPFRTNKLYNSQDNGPIF